MIISKFLFVVLFLSIPLASMGAHLSVSPTRVDLSQATKSKSIKIINPSDKAVNLQVFVKAWTQEDNGDTVLEESRGLVVFPKLLKVDANGERPIRVGYRGDWPSSELPFRLLIEQIPEAVAEGGLGVVMPLRLSVPVFVADNTIPVELDGVVESAEKQAGGLRIAIRNAGLRHFTVKRLKTELIVQGGKTLATPEISGWYVLPGNRVYYHIPWEKSVCRQVVSVRITAEIGRASDQQGKPISTELEISDGVCTP